MKGSAIFAGLFFELFSVLMLTTVDKLFELVIQFIQYGNSLEPIRSVFEFGSEQLHNIDLM